MIFDTETKKYLTVKEGSRYRKRLYENLKTARLNRDRILKSGKDPNYDGLEIHEFVIERVH